ncbi:MAG TPA: glycosyltransferase family 2 protein [Povalibacter sp.]|nr:glycosyltransferase family 2 protein [Povalibacter sp.]
MSAIELSIVMPCLNEAATIAHCVAKARGYLARAGVVGEIIVADNGSDDGSRKLAAQAGARVVAIAERGYGAALRGGIAAARGRFVIMGDADASYDFEHLDGFVARLREGFDLVMGNRFQGGIRSGAMPLLHRYLGNPVLSFIGRLFFRVRIGDFHCGLRGFSRDAILRLNLTTPGMEFASEMVVKAALARLRITEVPTTLSPDGRDRPPHLRTWRDGWRHLRFLLTFSPRWLFLYPGMTLFVVGVGLQALLAHGAVRLGNIGLDIHTMLYAAAMSVMGVQMIWFAIFAKVFGARAGLLPDDARFEWVIRTLTLERGVAIGLVLLLGGIALSAGAVHTWASTHYGALDPRDVMRVTIPSVTMMLLGMEFILASFFLGMLRFETADGRFREKSGALPQYPLQPDSPPEAP